MNLLLWALTGALSADTAEKSNPDSAEVARIVAEYHNALSSGDSAKALRLLAADATILESGARETREEYRAHHLGGDIAFARAVKATRTPIVVTILGNTAWTASTSITQGTYNGREINSSGAESMILTKSRDGWRIRQIHWSSRVRRAPSS